jgi:hypothetical protein
MEARMPLQPALDFGVFLRGVVVGDQMDLLILRRHLIIN